MRSLLVVLIALATARGLYAQQVPQWKGVRDLRVGDVDDPDYTLTWMMGIALGRDGSIFSLHYPEKLVRVFNSAGRLQTKFGRPGNGPGEFNNPARIGWRGDSLWIYDSVQRRFNLYDATGRTLQTLTIIPTGTMRNSPLALTTDGRVVAELPLRKTQDPREMPERTALVRLLRTGELQDTMAVFASSGKFVRIAGPDGKWNMVTTNPFSTGTLVVAAPDGSAVYLVERPAPVNAREGTFTVQKIPATGTPTVHRYNYVPQRVTRVQSDSALASTLKSVAAQPGMTPASAQRLVEQAMPVSPYHPPVQEVIAGSDGSLWLRREDLSRPTHSWFILDEQGRMIATVDLPRHARFLAATRTYVIAEERDELDVSYITRYRITP
jgi:hypothetical protein